ncbi:unnamed protein product, partial [Nesidiocoris tenuis]
MVRRKLQALNYHSADTVDIHDPQQVRALVLWLEDQVIRNYKIEDRLGLRNLDSPSWTDAFRKYCTDIDCPISPDEQLECLDWITGYAVRLEYFDDLQSDEFRNGVNSLANLLKIAPHPNHLITLEAICALITNSMKDKDLKKEGHPFPVMETDLGFDLGDYVLNQAAKVLRLLYTHDLRDLQTKINECIVAVQSVTADPKTDTKLGKMVYYMRSRRVATAVAKPLLTNVAHDHTAGIVNATILARVGWQLLSNERLNRGSSSLASRSYSDLKVTSNSVSLLLLALKSFYLSRMGGRNGYPLVTVMKRCKRRMDNPESNRRKVWRPSDATSQSTSQTIPKNPWRDQRQRGRSSSVQGRQNPRASGAGLSLFEVLHQNEQSPQGGELSVGGLPFAQDSKRLLSPSNADWKNPSKKIKGKKGLKGSSGKIEDWRNSDSNLSASSDAGCSHFTGAAPHLQTEFKQNNLKPNLRRHGNQRFQADHNITQLVTISDWRALASLDSPLRILLKLQELESSWVRALHSNPSADVLSAAFEIFGIIDDKYTYDRLSLMKSLFKDTFFTSIINILKNLKTSWFSMGIENICSFVANLRENLKFLLLNDPAFHSDDTLQCALENLRAEIAAFLIHVNNKLLDLQGEEDARLNKELTEFTALYSIKSIEVKVVEESSYPDDFLAPYDVFPNIVQGAYQNYDHYIKTHFSLLKEDFQSVMREGVEQYLDDPKKRNFKIWAYQNVLVKPFWISEQKLLFKITFPECHYLARIQWKFCKRFMNNSLVVLTDDQFKTYHLAVVERREISGDNLAFIDVNFIKAVPQDFQKKKFLLVEPKTFFEPYLHSLAALKTMAKIGVPLKKYVVYADTTPKIPVYMGDDVVYKMDGLNIKINSLSSWPQPADLGLNEAQRTAFINALTNEVALIQGPPGTGKTYLAFKIISALLANRSVSYQKGPILVVCYKNHSLDQILSGLLTKQIKVRRIGSQTKNHILKYEANVKRLPPPPTINSLKKEQLSLESKLDSYFKEIQLKEKYIEAMDDRLGIISLDVFKMFKVVEDQVNLNIVRWLMELVEVDSPDTPEVHHQLRTVALCWDGNGFYSESLVRLAGELNRILRLIERLDGKLHYDELSQACENYWASFENYLRLFNALKIQTDSVPCPDVKSPDFLFDELDLEERWALYNEWVRQLKLRLEEDITAAKEDVVAVRESLNEFDEIVLSETLKADDPAVIGVTTTLAAKHYASLSKLGPKIGCALHYPVLNTGYSCSATWNASPKKSPQFGPKSTKFSFARRVSHVCEQPCELINVNCPRKHRCAKKCREPCGSCKVPTEKTLPCNHKAVMPCNQDASKYICQQPCNRELPCHHTASMPCNQDISKVKCKNPCDRQLPCGHSCRNKCCEPCGPCREMPVKTICSLCARSLAKRSFRALTVVKAVAANVSSAACTGLATHNVGFYWFAAI